MHVSVGVCKWAACPPCSCTHEWRECADVSVCVCDLTVALTANHLPVCDNSSLGSARLKSEAVADLRDESSQLSGCSCSSTRLNLELHLADNARCASTPCVVFLSLSSYLLLGMARMWPPSPQRTDTHFFLHPDSLSHLLSLAKRAAFAELNIC